MLAKNVKPCLARSKYLLGVGIYALLAFWSLLEAYLNDKKEILTMLVAVIGYFGFMINDRIEMAASFERMEDNINNLFRMIEQLKSRQQFAEAVRSAGEITRVSSSEAFEHCIKKLGSAKKMYNTSFSAYNIVALGAHYNRWLNAIVSATIDNDCIIHEVMLSRERLNALRDLYKTATDIQKGAYLAFDISEKMELVKNIPLVEFCVFEDNDAGCEVIFGWSNSTINYVGADCFICKDKHVIDYFITHFHRFEQIGKPTYLNGNITSEGFHS